MKTGPIIFGEAGTNAQHAFMQLFHQGSEIIPADFLICAQASHERDEHHTQLISNALAQSKALMDGSDDQSILDHAPHKYFPGNRPSSTFLLDRLDAKRLGMLLAFYEHKIFVQGVVWGINSFDQWGVELGKSIAKSIHKSIDNSALPDDMDSSTAGLLHLFREKFIKL
jgi:glucose-6-phosphate isomerase